MILFCEIFFIAYFNRLFSLGVYHDGDTRNPLAAKCNDGDHLLASVIGSKGVHDSDKAHTTWFFSECTIAQLKFNLLDINQENGYYLSVFFVFIGS